MFYTVVRVTAYLANLLLEMRLLLLILERTLHINDGITKYDPAGMKFRVIKAKRSLTLLVSQRFETFLSLRTPLDCHGTPEYGFDPNFAQASCDRHVLCK